MTASGPARVPMIMQSESADCGLACVAMAARAHGHDVDLAALRRRFATGLRGMTLEDVRDVAAALHLNMRAVRVEPNQLRLVEAPAILHWDHNHFVVMVKATRNYLLIHDPAAGVRKVSLAAASDHFTGVAAYFEPRADFRPVRSRERFSLARLTASASGLRRSVIHIFLIAGALEVYSAAAPLLTQWLMDAALLHGDTSLVALVVGGLAALTVLQASMTWARSSAISWLNYLLSAQWPGQVFSHLTRLPLGYFQRRNLGDVTTRFGALEVIQRTLSSGFSETLLDGLFVVFAAAALAWYSPSLLAALFGAIGLYAIARRVALGRMTHAAHEQIHANSQLQTELLESVRGIQTIKLYGLESTRDDRFHARAGQLAATTHGLQRQTNWFAALNVLLAGALRALVAGVSAAAVTQGYMTVGMLVAALAYSSQAFSRATSFINRCVDWNLLGIQTDRLSDIALEEADPDDPPGTIAPAQSGLSLKGVTFAYDGQSEPVIEDFNLVVSQGECVALAGASGCGKTTVAKLVLGLLEPNSGRVEFGGVEIRKLGLGRYRKMVGTVMQDDCLFAGTVADNIAMFDSSAPLEDVRQAARAAQIESEIEALPMGYETPVGDMGSVFSGGQRQRLLLARALFRRPRLLVLDEATSHLDLDNERRVNAVIKSLKITRLIIAHRPETIAAADRVIHMDVLSGRLQTETAA